MDRVLRWRHALWGDKGRAADEEEGIPNRGVSVLPGPRLEELEGQLPRSDGHPRSLAP